MKNEIYISTDIEANGPIPGPFSMLSFGSVAFDEQGKVLGQFSANLEELPEASEHPDTMKWWSTQKDAWEQCRTNLQDPALAMKSYVKWVKSFPGRPVFVAYPASFDFLFIYWYLRRFLDESPFLHFALDIKSFAMGKLGKSFHDVTLESLTNSQKENTSLSHVAVEDALIQGKIFCNMLK